VISKYTINIRNLRRFYYGKIPFCDLESEPEQKIILSNHHCLFLQVEEASIKGSLLEGARVIIPKNHSLYNAIDYSHGMRT